MIDDGVLGSREEFGGRVAGVAFDPDNHGAPRGSHGTRVASVAAGAHFGPAKDAVVVDVHAFDDPSNDWDHEARLVSGLEWILEQHPRGRPGVVAGNSWGLAISRGQARR